MSSTLKNTSHFKKEWELNFLVVENSTNQVQCIVCSFIFNKAKYFNIKRHYDRRHKSIYANCSDAKKITLIDNFKLNFSSNELPSTSSSDNFSFSSSCLEASMEVSLEIARSGYSYISGNFVKRCAIKMAKAFNNEKIAEQFRCVPLSRQTVSRRVNVLSVNVKQKLQVMINNCRYFSLCLDESTDVTDISQLLIYIRLIQNDFSVHEELLALKPLHDTTKGTDIYAAFMAAINDFGTNLLNKCSCIVTDGAPAMTGLINGLVGLLKTNGINCPTLHCIIHQEALCGKCLNLSSTMKTVTKVTNLIRGGNRSLIHRKLKAYLDELKAQYGDLLLHNNVRWLSAGKCLVRFFSLRKEILDFLKNHVKNSESFQQELKSSSFLCELAFLTDITAH